MQGAQQLGALLVRGPQPPDPPHEGVRAVAVRDAAAVRGPVPQQPYGGRPQVGGEPVGRGERELAQRGQPQPRAVGRGALGGQHVQRGGVRRVEACEQAEGPHERQQDPVLALGRNPLPQQVQDAGRTVDAPYDSPGGRPAHPRVRIPEEDHEHLGVRAHLLTRACVAALRADADQQFHDADPVRHRLAGRERDQEGNAGQRRVVHVSLVVHRAVQAVERGLPLGGVRGGQ